MLLEQIVRLISFLWGDLEVDLLCLQACLSLEDTPFLPTMVPMCCVQAASGTGAQLSVLGLEMQERQLLQSEELKLTETSHGWPVKPSPGSCRKLHREVMECEAVVSGTSSCAIFPKVASCERKRQSLLCLTQFLDTSACSYWFANV